MGDAFTDANNDRCYDCGKKYNVNFPHACPAAKNAEPKKTEPEMTLKRARELARACGVEYDYRFKEFDRAQRELEKAEVELQEALDRVKRLQDTPGSS